LCKIVGNDTIVAPYDLPESSRRIDTLEDLHSQ